MQRKPTFGELVRQKTYVFGRKLGYVDWITSDVDVLSDRCHSGPGPVVTVVLLPRL